jgi:hypothetical protein
LFLELTVFLVIQEECTQLPLELLHALCVTQAIFRYKTLVKIQDTQAAFPVLMEELLLIQEVLHALSVLQELSLTQPIPLAMDVLQDLMSPTMSAPAAPLESTVQPIQPAACHALLEPQAILRILCALAVLLDHM